MLAPGTRFGPFRIVALLGKGGMGEVYRAHDERLDRDIALKLFKPPAVGSDSVDRFVREAQAASALNHPNIVTIHEVGESDDGRFIVMELVEGRTVGDLITERLPIDAVIRIGIQLAKALSVAHAAGITHRDIKPENIMVRDDDYVKILDFGLARLRPGGSDWTHDETAEATAAITKANVVIGTYRYMSPEQADGSPVDSSTDVFSLGLVLYELLTRQHPFAAPTALAVVHAIASNVALAPSYLNPTVPPGLDLAILRMLDKNPRLRPTASEVADLLAGLHSGTPRIPSARVVRRFVGRLAEYAQLAAALDDAEDGRGSLRAVTGEPGLGKTTLVEDFLHAVARRDRPCWIARGRCSERLAGTDAYLPLLEALDSLIRGRDREAALSRQDDSIAGVLERVAPAWYAQVVPLAIGAADRGAPHEKATSQEEVKREFVSFLQEASRSRPVVLFLDDIHWADASTTDLLAYLGDRLADSRIVIIVTYRPSDLLLSRHRFHALQLELQSRGVCREIPLTFLSRDEVDELIALEFPQHQFPSEFRALIHTRTDGHPLFLTSLLHDLRRRHVITETDGRWMLAESVPSLEQALPESIRSMLQRKVEQLEDADRRLLMAASVQGPEFDSFVVSRALQAGQADVEERLAVLERLHVLVRRVGEREFPDGTFSVRYRFVHMLYHNALFSSLVPTRRASLSAVIAATLVSCYRDHTPDVASELALLFVAARDPSRAAEFFLLAARNAMHLLAHHEAVTLARRGLELLSSLPTTPERTQLEIALQVLLGSQLQVTQGFASSEMGAAYARARELCREVPGTPELFPALLGVQTYLFVRADYHGAIDVGDEMLRRAEAGSETIERVWAHQMTGLSRMMLGEFDAARSHLETAIAIYVPGALRSAFYYGIDVSVTSRGYLGLLLTLLGLADQGLMKTREMLTIADSLPHPLTLAAGLRFGAWMFQLRREALHVAELSEKQFTVSTTHRFPFYAASARFQRGWARAEISDVTTGIAEMTEGLAAWRATGAAFLSTFYLGLLAETYGHAGRFEEGHRALDEALAFCERSDERCFEAELQRLRGELWFQDPAPHLDEAERSFLAALNTARAQGAKWFELRTATSLARLLRTRGRHAEARELLTAVHASFTEGSEAPDLRAARRLLDELTI